MNSITEYITFSGHSFVKAKHRTTLEITKSKTLTEQGICIIGVKSDKSCKNLNADFKRMLSNDLTKVTITIHVNDSHFIIHAMGHSSLILSHPEDIVIRKSSFICDRTLAIKSDKAAIDIPETIVSELRNEDSRYSMEIMVHQ